MADAALQSIARGPTLRAAINLGNRALAREVNGHLEGPSPTLARRLAHALNLPLEPVIYDGAGKVFADAQAGAWDVAFLAIDPARACKVSFTRPYKRIEATYCVRAGSPVTDPEDADRGRLKILVGNGSAYDLWLTKHLKQAELIRAADPGESFERFRAGEGDLVGGVRESLERHFGTDPAYRILPGRITAIEQAMVLPGHDASRIAALDAFVALALAEGVV